MIKSSYNLSSLCILVILFLTIVIDVKSKVYDPCDLAKELLYIHKFERSEIADWICLIDSESSFRTHVIGPENWDGSHDHGLFQVSFCCSRL